MAIILRVCMTRQKTVSVGRRVLALNGRSGTIGQPSSNTTSMISVAGRCSFREQTTLSRLISLLCSSSKRSIRSNLGSITASVGARRLSSRNTDHLRGKFSRRFPGFKHFDLVRHFPKPLGDCRASCPGRTSVHGTERRFWNVCSRAALGGKADISQVSRFMSTRASSLAEHLALFTLPPNPGVPAFGNHESVDIGNIRCRPEGEGYRI